MTPTVWVLLLWVQGMARQEITVSNISTEAECHRLAAEIQRLTRGSALYHCISYQTLKDKP
jgi:hypothetical protein